MKRVFVTVVLSAIVLAPWSSAVAAGRAARSGGQSGSTAAMGAKGARVRHDREVVGIRGFRGFHGFGSTRVDDQSFLIVDAGGDRERTVLA